MYIIIRPWWIAAAFWCVIVTSKTILAFGPHQKVTVCVNNRHHYPSSYGTSLWQPHFVASHGRHQQGRRTAVTMGMQITIRIVGRNKSGSDKWLEEACKMYEQRLRPSNLEVTTVWHKDNAALIKGTEADQNKGHTVILLDPLGKPRTSEQFAQDMYQWLDQGGSRLAFVIGGADGLPQELKTGQQRRPMLLSLSSLTFTHQFARVLLIEQIYRASEIRKGSNYHK